MLTCGYYCQFAVRLICLIVTVNVVWLPLLGLAYMFNCYRQRREDSLAVADALTLCHGVYRKVHVDKDQGSEAQNRDAHDSSATGAEGLRQQDLRLASSLVPRKRARQHGGSLLRRGRAAGSSAGWGCARLRRAIFLWLKMPLVIREVCTLCSGSK